MTNLILLIIFGYLLGSTPFGYLISKAKGIDIRKVGSGNIGGTNVIRAFGIKWGLLVVVLDILKAVIPVYLAIRILPLDWQIAVCAITPILGHVFPIWLNFKGGKGVASTFGVLLILLGWQGLLVLILIQVLILASVKIMSFSSLTMASFIPLVICFFSYSLPFYVLGIALTVLIWWSHRENLIRIKEDREPKFRLKETISQHGE